MKKFERIISLIILISWLLKFLDLPVNLIFVFFSFVLFIFYLLFTIQLINNVPAKGIFIKAYYQHISALRTIGLIALGIGLSLIIIGIVFIAQNWIGCLSNLISGFIVIIILAIISFIKRNESNDKIFYDKILFRIFFWLFFGIIVFITSDKIYL